LKGDRGSDALLPVDEKNDMNARQQDKRTTNIIVKHNRYPGNTGDQGLGVGVASCVDFGYMME